VSTLGAAAAAVAEQLGMSIAVLELADATHSTAHAAGRMAARQAFTAADAPGLEIAGRADDGRPRFPDGWTGSITHGAGYAIAVVAPTEVHQAVGIDVEVAGSLPLRDAELVLNAPERRAAAAARDPDACATLLWSAKESAFKAWSVASGGLTPVDPTEIRVELDDDGAMRVTAARALLHRHPGLQPLIGRWAIATDVALTALVDEPISTRTRARDR
jgi:4'-phosphopantetheinyl transferase EntD